MNKTKSNKKPTPTPPRPTKNGDDADTSDDDYVDPEMDKYFAKKGGESKIKNAVNGKSGLWNEDDEDLSEYEEDSVEENSSDEDQDDEMEENENEIDNEKNEKDEEENDGMEGRKKLTLNLIKKWSTDLGKEKPFRTITEVIKAFKASLLNVVPNQKTSELSYRVEGSELFNAMVRLCIRDLLPSLLRILDLASVKKAPSENDKTNGHGSSTMDKVKLASTGSNWKKLKVPIKSYLEDMLILVSNINEATILNAMLRHMRMLINFYMCFPKVLKSLIKLLIQIWSQSDEKSRVISYICLHKIVTNSHEKNQDYIYKNLYLSFARNSKFTSINTLPMINFMQRSIIEIYSSNSKLAYEHVFVYIRQLAIHLRNAMNLKKKESYQAVYNWQFVHSLILWSKLLSSLVKTNNGFNEYLQPLIYPLIQCIIGTIKLIPTPRYYPLRFHCINALIILSNSTNVFIPIIPFVLEVFDITDFNKQHATISVKQLNFSFLLKLSKQQLQDKSFKDTLIDVIYDNLILLLQEQSHDISFPELVLPLVIRLKDFAKKCKNGNYCKVMKGLLEKIHENSKCIEERRSKATFSLKSTKEVDLWIEKNKELGTPLSIWYKRYKTMREREIMMEVSNKEIISKNQVPVIQKPERSNENKEEERKEFDGLFVNLTDDDDSDTDLLDFVPKKKMKLEDKNGDNEEEEEEDDFEDALKGTKDSDDE